MQDCLVTSCCIFCIYGQCTLCPPITGLCYLPNVVGSCRAAFTRYYYDVTDQTCKTFVYGGCQGNANNFESQEDCESACGGVTENCLVPPVVGPCRASIQKYFYNSSVGTCQIFTYGGCKGNKNNYPTLEMCMATCKENCGKPSDSGMCRAAFPMYYYDSNTKGCEKFIYGGCGGNENRFFSQDECTTKCAESDGRLRNVNVKHDSFTWLQKYHLDHNVLFNRYH
uniref:BPTI/Kunitz inhibitor domain-containing protein n=1 Tax=Denticeps clupeoides TaxID=299321 RepID=A0AAY4EAL1_9TELE